VGYSRDATGQEIGFIYADGKFTDLRVPGSLGTFPYRINSRRQVAGYFLDNTGHASGFVWTEGQYQPVNVPGASETFVYGMNEKGELVGSFIDSSGTHGFLETDGIFMAFDAPATLATFGTFARDINDAGEILVFGFGTGTFIGHLDRQSDGGGK
jgi:hypothetical protein